MQPGVLAAIAIGGALGAPLRYEVAERVHVGPGAFPWATFWTNAVGSLALGFVVILLIERFPDSRVVRPFLTAGLLGAFTTYSTFVVEVDVLIKDGRAALGIVYLLSSTVAGFTAAWAGMQSARMVPRTIA